ncbi:MAG: hypothetical protein AAGC47_08510 [Bacteroidota bacterium]
MQRGPAAANPLQIPRRAKRVIDIVDPKTNQAIKVEKATRSSSNPSVKPPPANIKIEPRTARPLSLESDPAYAKQQKSAPAKAVNNENESSDAEKSEKTGGNQVAVENSSKPKEIKPTEPKPPAKETPNSSEPTVEESDNGGVSPKAAERTGSVKDVLTPDVIRESSLELEGNHKEESSDKQSKPEADMYDQSDKSNLISSSNKADDNLDGMTSDVSSSTFADVRSDSTDGQLPNLTSKASDELQTSTSKSVSEAVEDDSAAQSTDSPSDQNDPAAEASETTTIKVEETSEVTSDVLDDSMKNGPEGSHPTSAAVEEETSASSGTNEEQETDTKEEASENAEMSE